MQDKDKMIDEIKEEEMGDTPTPDEVPTDEEQSEPLGDGMNAEEEPDMSTPDMPESEGPEMGEPEMPEAPMEPIEKTFTQSQVNEMVGKARMEGRDSAMKALYGRYGVNGDSELDDMFGRGQAYDVLNDEYRTQGDQYRQVMAENALLKSKVDENRWDDIKLILGGKGLDISQENIESLIPSHPEWRGAQMQNQMVAPQQPAPMAPMTPPVQPGQTLTPDMAEQFGTETAMNNLAQNRGPVTTLRKLGNDMTAAKPQEERDQEAMLNSLFGMK